MAPISKAKMDNHLFRKGHWVIDLNDNDADNHLYGAQFTRDTILVSKYFVFLLYEETSRMGRNEFAERHDETKDAIIDVMRKKLGPGARQISAIVEGVVTKSLINDGCIVAAKPYPRWTGAFHEHRQPKNFYQLLEGALRDPRSRIGSVIDYPPAEEIFHVSEMIRNPLAHGAETKGTLQDYRVLFFLLILLYHDLVNPHGFPGNHKYVKWIDRMKIDLRLAGEEPTLEKLEELAVAGGLDADEVRKNYS
jgi:hypothetical protein